MIPRCKLVRVALLALAVVPFAVGDDKPAAKPVKLTDGQRQVLIRNFQSELVFAKRFFPMGKVGLRIENGNVTPSEAQVRQMVADFGPAAKPGDRAKITAIYFKGKEIIFELNGGPVKKKKWYERIEVGAGGGAVRPADRSGDDALENLNARGSYVALVFKDFVPEISSDELKAMLSPVIDFNSTSAAEAYSKSLPPIVQAAIKDHKPLVGMDRQMVTYAMGRPPRKHREREGDSEYEEWIYGQPPDDVQFVRFQGERVVRVETMKVDGEKLVRTQKEVDLDQDVGTALASKKTDDQEQDGKKGPSLLRPGETPAPVITGARPNTQQQRLPNDPNAGRMPSDTRKGGIDMGDPGGMPGIGSPQGGQAPQPPTGPPQ